MAYTRTNWEESVTPLSADNMNNIEDGIEQALAFGRNEAIDLLYPVNSIYLTTSNQNPSQTFGRGTWVAWGSGRVPVGVNANDTDFNTSEKTGGLKTHSHTNPSTGSTVLNINQIPAHTHKTGWDTKLVKTPGTSGVRQPSEPTGEGVSRIDTTSSGGGQGHSHTMSGTGSSSSLQPYITCYMWKRIG